MRQRIVALGGRPEFWLACLLLWLLGSLGRSLGTPWERVALTEALRWGAGIGLLLALSHCRSGAEQGAKFATVLVGLLALLGMTDGTRLGQGGMIGPYHDHQLYASALLVLLPLSAALALSARENNWRLGGLAVLSAGMLCLVLSQTRSAWAGGLTAVLVFGGLWLRRTGQTVRHGRTLAVSTAVLFVGLAAVWMLVDTASLRSHVADRAATLTSLSRDGSWQTRLVAWQGAERLIETYPLLGIGLGRYPSTQQAWTHLGRSLETTTRPSLSEEAHNFYLQTTAEIGIIGLGLYLATLAAYALLGFRFLRPARHKPLGADKAIVMATVSALAGQLVDALASPSWQFAETSLFFWAVLGLGGMALREKKVQAVSVPLPPRKRLLSPQWAAGLAFVAFTAEILPLGLLTPVEAYTAPTGWTFTGLTMSLVSSPAIVHPRDTLTFQLIAHYKDSKGNSQDVDVSHDSGTTFSAFRGSPLTAINPNPFVKNVCTIPNFSQLPSQQTINVTFSFIFVHNGVTTYAQTADKIIVPVIVPALGG